eukprot:Colp12_sorted_trinity150504_noHs@16484
MYMNAVILKALVECLKRHVVDETVAECCSAMFALAFFHPDANIDVCAQMLADLKAVPVLLDCLKKHPDNFEVVQKVGLTLQNVFKSETARRQCVQANGILTLANCLKQNMHSVDAIECCMSPLRNLLVGDLARQQYIVLDLIPILIGCLKKHSAHADLVIRCAQFISNFLLDGADNDEIQECVLDAGGIVVLLYCLKRHMADAKAVEKCVKVFRDIVANERVRQQYVRIKIVPILIDCIKGHPSSAGVLTHCCWTINQILSSEENLGSQCLKLGAPALILNGLKLHIANADATEACILALMRICLSADGRDELINLEAAPTLVQCMRVHMQSASHVVGYCACMLSGLLGDARARDQTSALGVVAVVEDALNTHPNNSEINTHCRVLLVMMTQ